MTNYNDGNWHGWKWRQEKSGTTSPGSLPRNLNRERPAMTDVSKEAVEEMAQGLEDHAARTNMGFRKSHEADTLRALYARIEELEDHILELQERTE